MFRFAGSRGAKPNWELSVMELRQLKFVCAFYLYEELSCKLSWELSIMELRNFRGITVLILVGRTWYILISRRRAILILVSHKSTNFV